MDDVVVQWVKIVSFAAAMLLSFMIGRAFEKSRMIRFFSEQGEEIEKVLDEFFTPENPYEAGSRLAEIRTKKFGQENRYLA